MSTAIDAIKKRGTFKVYAEAHELYVEQCGLAKQFKSRSAELDKATSKGERTSKKSSEKAKEDVAMADTPDPELHAIYQQDLKKAKEATETTKAKEECAAKEMFRFYRNLLPADAKYVWNKILKEQTASNPYKVLQGVSKKEPRGPSHKSFDDCVMFHLFTIFPNNAAKQEKVLPFERAQEIPVRQRASVCAAC